MAYNHITHCLRLSDMQCYRLDSFMTRQRYQRGHVTDPVVPIRCRTTRAAATATAATERVAIMAIIEAFIEVEAAPVPTAARFPVSEEVPSSPGGSVGSSLELISDGSGVGAPVSKASTKGSVAAGVGAVVSSIGSGVGAATGGAVVAATGAATGGAVVAATGGETTGGDLGGGSGSAMGGVTGGMTGGVTGGV